MTKFVSKKIFELSMEREIDSFLNKKFV